MRVNISKHAIEAKIQGAFDKGLAILSEEILKDCNYYCKRAEGALIASSLIHSRLADGQLIWQTPYAKRQYWEIRTAYTDANPNATWKWCEVAKRNHEGEWERKAQRLFEENL